LGTLNADQQLWNLDTEQLEKARFKSA